MALEIVHYPHPTLRFRSLPVKRVDKQLRMLVDEMRELMYAHDGVGLAANQVDLPLRLFIVNPAGDRQQQDEERVVVNPVIERPKGSESDREGCLSLPGLYGSVVRPKQIQLSAFDLKGNPIELVCDGFLARVLQHENDHLNGTLFFDRMNEQLARELRQDLDEFENEFAHHRAAGQIGDDATLARQRQEWIERYA